MLPSINNSNIWNVATPEPDVVPVPVVTYTPAPPVVPDVWLTSVPSAVPLHETVCPLEVGDAGKGGDAGASVPVTALTVKLEPDDEHVNDALMVST